MSRFFACTVIVLVLASTASLQSPEPQHVHNDPLLTEAFIKVFNDHDRDIAYRELIGYMTQALRGEHFGANEAKIQNRARKRGNDTSAEMSRLVIEMRNLSLRQKNLEARLSLLEGNQK